MTLQLSQPPATPLRSSELSPEILAIVNNRRITEHSAMIWNIPSTQTIYSVVAAFQEACGAIVGCGAMHDMREDPTMKCIRASFATPYSLQIALNLSGTLWGGSKLLIRKYKGPNHGKTNSNLLLAQNGFNLNGINNLPSNLTNMSMEDIQQHTSQQQQLQMGSGINPLLNNGAINAGRRGNKTVAQQIFSHLDMQQLAYLMLVQQHITQNKQFEDQQQREAKSKGREHCKKKKEKSKGGDKGDGADDEEKEDESSESIATSDIDTDDLDLDDLGDDDNEALCDDKTNKNYLEREEHHRKRKKSSSPDDEWRNRRRRRHRDGQDDEDDANEEERHRERRKQRGDGDHRRDRKDRHRRDERRRRRSKSKSGDDVRKDNRDTNKDEAIANGKENKNKGGSDDEGRNSKDRKKKKRHRDESHDRESKKRSRRRRRSYSHSRSRSRSR